MALDRGIIHQTLAAASGCSPSNAFLPVARFVHLHGSYERKCRMAFAVKAVEKVEKTFEDKTFVITWLLYRPALLRCKKKMSQRGHKHAGHAVNCQKIVIGNTSLHVRILIFAFFLPQPHRPFGIFAHNCLKCAPTVIANIGITENLIKFAIKLAKNKLSKLPTKHATGKKALLSEHPM
ncbi:hypothetical protein ACFE04_025390 [Oxalis oulophora]